MRLNPIYLADAIVDVAAGAVVTLTGGAVVSTVTGVSGSVSVSVLVELLISDGDPASVSFDSFVSVLSSVGVTVSLLLTSVASVASTGALAPAKEKIIICSLLKRPHLGWLVAV